MTKKVASSPERYTFQKENYIKRQEEQGLEPLEEYIELFKTWKQQDAANLVDPKWQKNNMEYDLRSSEDLCNKVKASNSYAQNLYAAMCNQEWQSREFWQEMKGETWGCSWRSSGGIIANMREQGDYMDWYCSGMGGVATYDLKEGEEYMARQKYVPEGQVTEEVELDLNKLGWRPVPSSDTLDD